jgi:hypothetical protein
MSKSKSIYDVVVATLAEMGVPSPDEVIETLMVRDGAFVGHVFRYEGGHATWWLGSPTIEFHDETGNMVNIVSRMASKKGEAA